METFVTNYNPHCCRHCGNQMLSVIDCKQEDIADRLKRIEILYDGIVDTIKADIDIDSYLTKEEAEDVYFKKESVDPFLTKDEAKDKYLERKDSLENKCLHKIQDYMSGDNTETTIAGKRITKSLFDLNNNDEIGIADITLVSNFSNYAYAVVYDYFKNHYGNKYYTEAQIDEKVSDINNETSSLESRLSDLQNSIRYTAWNDAYNKRHTHSNKDVLDNITESDISSLRTAYSWGNHANAGYIKSVKINNGVELNANGSVNLPGYPTTLPASDVYSWAKQPNKPTYSLDEVLDGSTRKLSDYTQLNSFNLHKDNTAIHITSDERNRWNKTTIDLSNLLGSDTNDIIDKWNEIISFLSTYTEADTLANLLSNKVNTSDLANYQTKLTQYVKNANVSGNNITFTISSPLTDVVVEYNPLIPTSVQQANWDAAYSWGNHANAGYVSARDLNDITRIYDASQSGNTLTLKKHVNELTETTFTYTPDLSAYAKKDDVYSKDDIGNIDDYVTHVGDNMFTGFNTFRRTVYVRTPVDNVRGSIAIGYNSIERTDINGNTDTVAFLSDIANIADEQIEDYYNNNISDRFNNYLPLTGGTVTGNLRANTNIIIGEDKNGDDSGTNTNYLYFFNNRSNSYVSSKRRYDRDEMSNLFTMDIYSKDGITLNSAKSINITIGDAVASFTYDDVNETIAFGSDQNDLNLYSDGDVIIQGSNDLILKFNSNTLTTNNNHLTYNGERIALYSDIQNGSNVDFSDYLPKSGGTLTGALTINATDGNNALYFGDTDSVAIGADLLTMRFIYGNVSILLPADASEGGTIASLEWVENYGFADLNSDNTFYGNITLKDHLYLKCDGNEANIIIDNHIVADEYGSDNDCIYIKNTGNSVNNSIDPYISAGGFIVSGDKGALMSDGSVNKYVVSTDENGYINSPKIKTELKLAYQQLNIVGKPLTSITITGNNFGTNSKGLYVEGKRLAFASEIDNLENNIADTLDDYVLSTTLNNYLPKSGGTLTGNLFFNNKALSGSNIVIDDNPYEPRIAFMNSYQIMQLDGDLAKEDYPALQESFGDSPVLYFDKFVNDTSLVIGSDLYLIDLYSGEDCSLFTSSIVATANIESGGNLLLKGNGSYIRLSGKDSSHNNNNIKLYGGAGSNSPMAVIVEGGLEASDVIYSDSGLYCDGDVKCTSDIIAGGMLYLGYDGYNKNQVLSYSKINNEPTITFGSSQLHSILKSDTMTIDSTELEIKGITRTYDDVQVGGRIIINGHTLYVNDSGNLLLDDNVIA